MHFLLIFLILMGINVLSFGLVFLFVFTQKNYNCNNFEESSFFVLVFYQIIILKNLV